MLLVCTEGSTVRSQLS